MKKVLFINACPRIDSRTLKLARNYFELLKNSQEIQVQEVKVCELKLKPLCEQSLLRRNAEIESGNLSGEEYKYAKDFAAADLIVVAAPFWDASYPAVLKTYIENICVNTITFEYNSKGIPQKKCHAEKLIYITTAGGFLPEVTSVQLQWQELCNMFSIREFRFYAADRLDIVPADVEKILSVTMEKIASGEKLK